MDRPKVSIDIDYHPISDDTDTGFQRPPRIAACVVEYLWVIGNTGDDGGAFSEDELQALIDSPSTFFTPLTGAQKDILRFRLADPDEYYVHPATFRS